MIFKQLHQHIYFTPNTKRKPV